MKREPIPIAIHPLFWLSAALLGYLYGKSLMGALIWMGIIFGSVLVHELGHALAAVFFGQKAKIQLIAFGGLTTYDGGPALKFWQQFLIVLNGPLFGLGLCLLATLALKLPVSPPIYEILRAIQLANFFWSAVNLLPVLPLDGGQLLRIVLEGLFGLKGFKASLIVGALLSFLIASFSFVYGYFLAGAFFFLFAFQSFDTWRKARFANLADRSQENNQLMMQAEEALKLGQNDEAKRLFEKICCQSPDGILSHAATQYLAFFEMKEGKKEEAYQRLLPIKDELAEESICLLHQLAFEHANDSLVADLSTACYRLTPSQEVALRNARSFARLKQPTYAGGWLQTAWQHGAFNIEEVLKESSFLKVKEDAAFLEFINPLRG